MKQYLSFWESLTNDPVIVDAIKRHHIEFEAEYLTQTIQPNKINFSVAKIMIIKLVSREVYASDGFIQIVSFVLKKMCFQVDTQS